MYLEKEIEKGQFREDLYYRLNRFPIRIPPLRNRLDDIPKLCQRLIQKINHDYGRNVEGLDQDAITILKQYHWPGNVRELENILGRAIIFMNYNETLIRKAHLPPLDINQTKVDENDLNPETPKVYKKCLTIMKNRLSRQYYENTVVIKQTRQKN